MRLCGEKQQWEDQVDQWSGSKEGRSLTTAWKVLGGSLWAGEGNLGQRPGKVLNPGRLWGQSSWSGW